MSQKVEISTGIFMYDDFVFVYIYFIKRWQEVKKITKVISRIPEFREVVCTCETHGTFNSLITKSRLSRCNMSPDVTLYEVLSMEYSCQKVSSEGGKLTSKLQGIRRYSYKLHNHTRKGTINQVSSTSQYCFKKKRSR